MSPRTRKLLAPALLLTCMTAAFKFNPDGIAWFWSAQPIVAMVLALGAAVAWGCMVLPLHKHSQPHA
ncbi:MAG TPA: hypothetical protein VFL63_11905 [Rhodanobacteraceae bacterium]|jgi:hypothetical protein|nr:hypothetical protein [Rhodanobacteraceae bacterium]